MQIRSWHWRPSLASFPFFYVPVILCIGYFFSWTTASQDLRTLPWLLHHGLFLLYGWRCWCYIILFGLLLPLLRHLHRFWGSLISSFYKFSSLSSSFLYSLVRSLTQNLLSLGGVIIFLFSFPNPFDLLHSVGFFPLVHFLHCFHFFFISLPFPSIYEPPVTSLFPSACSAILLSLFCPSFPAHFCLFLSLFVSILRGSSFIVLLSLSYIAKLQT